MTDITKNMTGRHIIQSSYFKRANVTGLTIYRPHISGSGMADISADGVSLSVIIAVG